MVSALFIAIYVAISLVTYYFVVHKLAKGHIKNKDNKELLEKLEPFHRTDVNNWNVIKLLPMVLTFWPRWIIGMINLFQYAFTVNVLMIGISDFSQVGPIRYQLIKRLGQISMRLHMLLAGVIWIKKEYVVEESGYEKWLGPDWKPKWEGAGTLVSNHVCWMDILTLLIVFFPSFVAKKEVKSYPGVGSIATAIDCLFVDRAGTKEEK